MRIKIIGDNNCARATRQLLRMAGFAVTEFLPAEAITRAPHFGYAITIELAPAALTPDAAVVPEPGISANVPTSVPGSPTYGQPAAEREETFVAAKDFAKTAADVSSPSFVAGFGWMEGGSSADASGGLREVKGRQAESCDDLAEVKGRQAEACPTQNIHFDSVDGALEGAVLRHVTQLAVAPVMIDRPGGVVRSERELRIVVPLAVDVHGRVVMDEAAAVAVEFGVLRGLLDIVAPKSAAVLMTNVAGASNASGASKTDAPEGTDMSGVAPSGFRNAGGKKKRWWVFGALFVAGSLLGFAHDLRGESLVREFNSNVVPLVRGVNLFDAPVIRNSEAHEGSLELSFQKSKAHRLKIRVRSPQEPVLLNAMALAALPAQGQFATGQGTKITDGTNTLVVDPCKAQTKLYVSINQTANAQLVAGTTSKKIYICSIHVVVAAATNVALVEGTGTVCATGTSGVSGFGGATAATGWNFAGNSGIALGNGDAAVGAQGTAADNLCLYNSGSGQVSGGISYVVQ